MFLFRLNNFLFSTFGVVKDFDFFKFFKMVATKKCQIF